MSCEIFNRRNRARGAAPRPSPAKLMNRACRRIQIFVKRSNYPIQQLERSGPNFRVLLRRWAFCIGQIKPELWSVLIKISRPLAVISPTMKLALLSCLSNVCCTLLNVRPIYIDLHVKVSGMFMYVEIKNECIC